MKIKSTLKIKQSSKQPTQFQYTLSDDKLLLVKRKIFVFRQTWNIIKDFKKGDKASVFWESYNTNVKFTDYHDEVIAKQLLESVYLNSARVRQLKTLENILCEKQKNDNSTNKMDLLLFASETTYEEALKAHISNNEDIRSDEYLVRFMNDSRLCLFLIGREYEWKHDGKHVSVKMPGDIQLTIGDACNPVSNSLKQNVRKHFKELGRTAKMTVLFQKVKEEGEDSEEDNEGGTTVVQSLNKNSLPVNIAICYHLIQRILLKLLESIRTINHSARILNLGNVLLLTMCCLHEGCRPIEMVKSQKHNDFYFWLNEVQYPLLVLAFVKPETLVTLMESGELLRYTVEFYKSRKLRKRRSRVKSWLPIQYNSLDLATIYILVMRIIATYDLESMCSKFINTNDQARLTKKVKEIVDDMLMKRLSLYSIRTAAAEEDKEFSIPMTWTRYRMGHVEESLMRNRYARNLNQRVRYGTIGTMLGCDVGANGATDNNVVPLFFKKEQGVITVRSNISAEIIDELNTVSKALKQMIDHNVNNLQCHLNNNKIYVAKDKVALLADLKKIPFGSEFVFRDQLIPTNQTYRTNARETSQSIHTFFKPITGDYTTIILWSYPQIMYGEFNTQLRDDAKKNSDEVYRKQKECIELYESLAVHLGVEPDQTLLKSKNRDTVAEMQHTINNKKRKATTEMKQIGTIQIQESKRVKTNCTKKTKKWFFDDIEVNDIVALRTSEINADYIGIPGQSSGFTLMYIETIDARNCRVSGKCFRGSVYELVMKDIIVSKRGIADNDVLWIWTLEDDEDPKDFSIPTADIKTFCSSCV
jgi:hypothetical protein